MVSSHTLRLSCGFRVMNKSPPAGEACSASSGEPRTDTRRPSASLTVEATEANGFLVLELTTSRTMLTSETSPMKQGFSGQGVPQPASLTRVPDSGDPSKPGEIR